MPPSIILLLLLGCFFVALLFFVRILCGPFSAKTLEQMKKHPVVHVVWAVFAIVSTYILFIAWNPSAWPPTWLERRTQRQKVLERVERGGGWEALRLECESLIASNPDGLTWHSPHFGSKVYRNAQTEPPTYYVTNFDYGPLPSAIAALQPRSIRCLPPKLLPKIGDDIPVAVVRINIFGVHSTAGHSTPYFALEVSCGPGADTFTPGQNGEGVSGNRHSHYRKVADRIFEIY